MKQKEYATFNKEQATKIWEERKPVTADVIKAAMDAVVKDVREPKVVRDGIIKRKGKTND